MQNEDIFSDAWDKEDARRKAADDFILKGETFGKTERTAIRNLRKEDLERNGIPGDLLGFLKVRKHMPFGRNPLKAWEHFYSLFSLVEDKNNKVTVLSAITGYTERSISHIRAGTRLTGEMKVFKENKDNPEYLGNIYLKWRI